MAKLPSWRTSSCTSLPEAGAPCLSPCSPVCPPAPITHFTHLCPSTLASWPSALPPASRLLLQGLCTGYFLSLEHSSPDSHSCVLTSFRSLLKRHLFRKVLLDRPQKTALLQPLAIPSLALQSHVRSYTDLFTVFCSSPHEIGSSLKRDVAFCWELSLAHGEPSKDIC